MTKLRLLLAALLCLAPGLSLAHPSSQTKLDSIYPRSASATFVAVNWDTTGEDGNCMVVAGTGGGTTALACGTNAALETTTVLLPQKKVYVRALTCVLAAYTGAASPDTIDVTPYHRLGTASPDNNDFTATLTIADDDATDTPLFAVINEATPAVGGGLGLRLVATDANASITDADIYCTVYYDW